MTSIVHTPQKSLSAVLQATLDEGSSFFRQPPSVTIVRTTVGESTYFRVFTANTKGEVICIDAHLRMQLRLTVSGPLRYAESRGFTLPRGRAPQDGVYAALRSLYGEEYVKTVVIREVL